MNFIFIPVGQPVGPAFFPMIKVSKIISNITQLTIIVIALNRSSVEKVRVPGKNVGFVYKMESFIWWPAVCTQTDSLFILVEQWNQAVCSLMYRLAPGQNTSNPAMADQGKIIRTVQCIFTLAQTLQVRHYGTVACSSYTGARNHEIIQV